MRTTLIAMLLLSATAAFAGEPNRSGPSEWQDKSGSTLLISTSLRQTSPWVHDQMLGDALGDWLGVHNGRWEMYDAGLAEGGGPTIGGTFKKGAAVIQLRWHPGE
jgi:hypothetical protein